MIEQRKIINAEIRRYWNQCKQEKILEYEPIKKKKVPRFTRHNGLKLKRLSRTGWRHPRSTQGNRASMMKPLIGYKNPESVRFCLRAYGKKIGIVANVEELRRASQRGEIPVISRTVGARKRIDILAYARANRLPVRLTG